LRSLSSTRPGDSDWGPFKGDAIWDYAELAVGEAISSQVIAEPLNAWLDEALMALRDRGSLEDEAIARFMAAKIFWDWKFRRPHSVFGRVDAKRFGVDAGEFAHLSILGEGKFWRQVSPGTFEPLPGLLSGFRGGALPGMERPLVDQVATVLPKDLFPGAKAHLRKASEFLCGESPDFENAVKEAVLALESAAKSSSSKSHGTLDGCLKEFAGQGVVTKEAVQILKALYVYRNAVPGVAHASESAPTVSEGEARLVLDAAASGVRLLAGLRRGTVA